MSRINKKKMLQKTAAIAGILGMLFLQIFPLGVFAACTTVEDCINNITGATSNATNVIGAAGQNSQNNLNKSLSPSVRVSFAPESGGYKNGAKITATAAVGGFSDKSEELYYTWYLKQKVCEKNPTSTDCDLDEDGGYDENDWKIAAARFIVQGDFNSSGVDYSLNANNNFRNSTAGVEAEPTTDEWDGDNGDNDSDSDENCYMLDEDSVFYELRDTTPEFNVCPSGYRPACIRDSSATCHVLNAEYTGAGDTTHPKSIERSFTACEVNTKENEADQVFDCEVEDMKNFTASMKCQESDGELNGNPMCVIDSGNTGSVAAGFIFGNSLTEALTQNYRNDVCDILASPNLAVPPSDFAPDSEGNPSYLNSPTNSARSCESIKTAFLALEANEDENGDDHINFDPTAKTFNNDQNSCTFNEGDNLCEHLFPNVPSWVDSETGDEKFTLKEKEFWGANPSKSTTNEKLKIKDEAAVMGLGVSTFVWTYGDGDEVGVAVEGNTSLPTQHDDASYIRTWAFSKGECEEFDDAIEDDNRAFYVENDLGIRTAEFDPNECLEENLIDPKNGDMGFYDMKIDLSATPQNPINDPNGDGDEVTITASVQNVEDLGRLFYDWQVEKSLDGSIQPSNETNWQAISDENIPENNGTSGLGKDTFSFRLNFPSSEVNPGDDGVFYLRIKATARDNSGAGSQTAKGYLDLKVMQQINKIDVHSVLADSNGMLSFNTSGPDGGVICSDNIGQQVCYVTANEIVGLEIPNNDPGNKLSEFNWKINNNEFSKCNEKISPLCSEDSNILFFPVLGNEGESVNVVVTATKTNSVTNTSETVEIKRHFVIVAPQVMIASSDESSAWPKLMGYYKDLNGNRYPDYSFKVYETQPGKTIFLEAAFYPSTKAGQAGFDWAVDGEIKYDYHNKSQISFPVSRIPGENYNIGLVATYNPGQDDQLVNLRKAFMRNWGVAPEEVIETENNASIQINVLDSNSVISDSGKSGIMASLITHLPQQTFFLLEITLTAFALFISIGLLFAFIPESIFENKKNQ